MGLIEETRELQRLRREEAEASKADEIGFVDLEKLCKITSKSGYSSQIKMLILNFILNEIQADSLAPDELLEKTVKRLRFIMLNSHTTKQSFSLRESSRELLFGILYEKHAMQIWKEVVKELTSLKV